MTGNPLLGARNARSLRFHVAGLWLLLPLLLLVGSGCDSDDEACVCCPGDTDPPAAPRGLHSITGDGVVVLSWLANTEPHLEGYDIWWSDEYAGEYEWIGGITACADDCYEEAVEVEVPNGWRRFYAVSAYDRWERESDLSMEYVWDTARPQGSDVTLSNALDDGGYDTAAFDLSARERVAADDPDADFWYEYDSASDLYLLVAGSAVYWPDDTVMIQDMGWTADFDEIDLAPPNEGWSPTATAEAILSHTYVLLTRAGNYAKIRVVAVGEHSLTFDWAYQGVPGERQLITPPTP